MGEDETQKLPCDVSRTAKTRVGIDALIAPPEADRAMTESAKRSATTERVERRHVQLICNDLDADLVVGCRAVTAQGSIPKRSRKSLTPPKRRQDR